MWEQQGGEPDADDVGVVPRLDYLNSTLPI